MKTQWTDRDKSTGGVYHEGIQCYVITFSYSPGLRQGILYIPASNSVDMNGTLNFFKTIDPDVRSIIVYRDGVLDVLYRTEGYIGPIDEPERKDGWIITNVRPDL